uniref:Zinc finger protein 385D-like isoform X2 n=1 Tax=Petromyzon marinus TaxID=7757 RepID=A0AAJ7TNF8_PETMA|nr:zinc finger protein 385D-like isoform X2 [Petromyzon marinus]
MYGTIKNRMRSTLPPSLPPRALIRCGCFGAARERDGSVSLLSTHLRREQRDSSSRRRKRSRKEEQEGEACTAREEALLTPGCASTRDLMESCSDAERPLEGSCDQPMETDEGFTTAASDSSLPLEVHGLTEEMALAAQLIEDAPGNGAGDQDGEQEVCTWRPSGCYALCTVCNLQLNSEGQVQMHFNGNAHRRRLRQITAQNGGTGDEGSPGGSCVPSCLDEHLCQAAPAQIASPADMDGKPFVSFPIGATGTVGLFPNFSAMDPVQKAVINHTFGLPVQPRKRQLITCNICQVRFNSQNQAEAHYNGSKHCKKLKALEALKARQSTGVTSDLGSPSTSSTSLSSSSFTMASTTTLSNSSEHKGCHSECTSSSTPGCEGAQQGGRERSPVPQQPNSEGAAGAATCLGAAPASAIVESDEEKAKRLLYCTICKVAVNSQSQLDAHNNGARHKATLEGKDVRASGRPFPRHMGRNKAAKATGSMPGTPTKNFQCQLCDVKVNSEVQLQQHIKSRRHKDKLTGKASKSKFSPYNKAQRASNRSSLLAKLTFRKELLNSLGLSFLQSPLSAAAAAFQATNVHYTAKLDFHKDLTRLPSAMTTTGYLPSPLAAATAAVAMRSPLTFHAAPAATASLFPSHGLAQALLRIPASDVRGTSYINSV